MTTSTQPTSRPASASALLRHFADLRDGKHGGLRAIAAVDIHNLVFQLGGDVRIIPATAKGLDE